MKKYLPALNVIALVAALIALIFSIASYAQTQKITDQPTPATSLCSDGDTDC